MIVINITRRQMATIYMRERIRHTGQTQRQEAHTHTVVIFHHNFNKHCLQHRGKDRGYKDQNIVEEMTLWGNKERYG